MNSVARITFVALAAIAATGMAQAQSDGPNNAGTVANDPSIGTQAWVSTSQAQGPSDGVFAFAAVGIAAESNYLAASNFGFSLAPTAVVLGIEVAIQKQTGGGTLHDSAVRIIKGGVIGATDKSDPNAWPAATPPPTVYGGPTDLWGETWTAADINAANFGVAIAGKDSVSGALAQVDSFAITVFYALCGDGIITSPTEQCDDSNTNNGDCCSSTCQFESSGSTCSDGNACTSADTCDGAGTCDPGTPVVCNDNDPCTQDTCNTGSGCVFTAAPRPALSCRTAAKSTLLIKSNVTTSKDKLVWKWLKGQATTFADFGVFGVPSGTAAYTLCVYSNTGAVLGVTIPTNSPNWTVIGANKGYKYKDLSGVPDGVQKALLKAGATGKAKAQVKGKGSNLPTVTLGSLPLPVTAQLVNSENNICYTTSFAAAKKNTTAQFKAKSP